MSASPNFGYGQGRMLQNINGCDNFFDPQEASPEDTTAEARPAPTQVPEPTGSFPGPDPTGISVLNKSLLPFDDHPFAQSLRSNPRRQPGAVNPEVERRVTAERRGRGGGSAQNSSIGPSHTYRMHYEKLGAKLGERPSHVSGYAGHVHKSEILPK
jgi:hypothetical protein